MIGLKNFQLKKGFESREFDSLPNGYNNDGSENRGYSLKSQKTKVTQPLPEQITLGDVSGEVVAYRCNPQRQFNEFTATAHQIFEPFALYVSEEKATQLGKKVKIDLDGTKFVLEVKVDDRMSGDIVKLPDFKHSFEIYKFFGQNRFKSITIGKA